MVKIILTGEQAGTMVHIMQRAYAEDGTIFCQAVRGTFPDHGQISIGCHFIPAESSKRLKAWLNKEAARIAQKGAPRATEQEATV